MSEVVLWVFPIDKGLQSEVREVAVALHQQHHSDQELQQVRKSFVHALNGVIDAGFDFYYVKPAADSDSLGPMVRRAVDSIMNTVRQAIHLVVQRIFRNMPLANLRVMAYYMDSMILTAPKNEDIGLLALPLNDGLGEQLMGVMDKIQASDEIHEYSDELLQVFSDIVMESAHYYYHLPTNYIKLNRFAKKAADIGVDTTVKGIKTVLKRVVREIDHKDISELPKYIHYLVVKVDVPYTVCAPEFIADK